MALNRKATPPGTIVRAGSRGGTRIITGKPQPKGDDRFRAKGLACRVAGCTRYRKARGYCNAHYLKFMKTGDTGGTIADRSDGGTAPISGTVRLRRDLRTRLQAYATMHQVPLTRMAATAIEQWVTQQERDAVISEAGILVEVPKAAQERAIRDDRIRRMATMGMSTYHIAQALEMHPDSVSRTKRRLGVDSDSQ